MFWRSKDILERPEGSGARSLYKSMGYSDHDLDRPMIGIANSWNRVVPGHYNLRLVSDYVKQGIFQGGGTPVEFGVIGDYIRFIVGAEPQGTQHVAVFACKNGFTEYAAFTIRVDGRLRD